MEQSSTSRSDPNIQKAEILSLLDSEINLISEQKNREGWTSWAVLGALGTLAWLLWESITKETISWENSFTIFLVLILGNLAYICFKEAAGLKELSASAGRFRYLDPYIVSIGVLNIPLFLSLMYLAYYLSRNVPLLAVILTELALCLILFLLFAALFFNYIRLPIPENSERTPQLITIWCFISIASLYSAYGYSRHLVNPSAFDLKVAVIIYSAMVLLDKLNPLRGATPYKAFINIRRQLVLGQIDTEAARKQAEIVIAGLEGSEVLRSEVDEFISMLSKVHEYRQKESEILDCVLEKLRKSEKPIADSILDDIDKKIIECKKFGKLCSDLAEPVKKKIARIYGRKSWVTANSKLLAREADSIMEKIDESLADVGKHTKLRDMKYEEVTRLLEQEVNSLKS